MFGNEIGRAAVVLAVAEPGLADNSELRSYREKGSLFREE